MSNPLTGDFDAVLQVSGGTIDRLMATLHHNAFTNPRLPSFPHSLQIRIGDDHAIDGVRGTAQLQIGVPRIDMINGSTRRFGLEVGVRAWFRPDYSTAPFPAFINGTVYAQYELADIDPHCAGWSQRAANYLWIRVIQDSVRFTGTADDDSNPLDSPVPELLAVQPPASAATIAEIQRQISVLLATSFAATPHPVSKRFQRGAMRTLNVRSSGSALVTALGLNGDPVGNIASVNNVLLDGADMAVGVSLDYTMSVITPALDPIKNFNTTVPVTIPMPWFIPNITTVYRVTVNPPSVAWQPAGASATLQVAISGDAKTDSVLADATFQIVQDVVLSFDPGSGSLTITPGRATVTVSTSGLGSDTVASLVKSAILAALPPIVQTACDQARPSLAKMAARTQDLTQQLRTLDDKAATRLTAALFTNDGMVLRGTITLTPRAPPVVIVNKLDDAFSALQSWIPGGQITKFEWSWTWGGPKIAASSGSAVREDRFLLRRPPANAGRWGRGIGLTTPLPGLDGIGSMCLKIVGVHVDPATGNLVPVQSTIRCTRYGMNVRAPVTSTGRLFLRDFTASPASGRVSDLPLVSARPAPADGASVNTLLLVAGERLDSNTATTLEYGLQRCARFNAGLSLLVLFREGVLDANRSETSAAVEAVGQKLGISAYVNEDVHGGWSQALGRHAGAAWAIVSPDGLPVWTHHGPLEAPVLTSALNTHLRRSPDAAPKAYGVSHLVGGRISAGALLRDLSSLIQSHCPPPPLGLRGPRGSMVAFVQKGSPASVAELTRLATQSADRDGVAPTIIAVVDGAGPADLEALKAEVGREFIAIGDAAGTVADRFGIEVWPTTLSVDGTGIIGDVAPGGMTPHQEVEGRLSAS
jgi:hypothetical protein